MALDIIDVRHLLPTGPGGAGRFEDKRGAVVHYSGGPVNQSGDTLTILRSYAYHHLGPYLREGGIAYHYDVGTDARVRLCRDERAVLWHCSAWPHNATHTAVHVMLGGSQRATEAQLTALDSLLAHLQARDGFGAAELLGHQEVSESSCPGTLMEWVYAYRSGGRSRPMADGFYFKETETFVGGAFWQYWQRHGGLPLFGYPISPERQEDGRTVQYFERARFEYFPEHAGTPYEVQLGHLGREALAARDG